MHGVDVPPHLTRVTVLEVRLDFEAWPLHEIPRGAERAMTLEESKGWLLRWPKTDIVLTQAPIPSPMHGDDNPASAAGNDRAFAVLADLSTIADLANLEGSGIFKDTMPTRDKDQPSKTTILTLNIIITKDTMAGQCPTTKK